MKILRSQWIFGGGGRLFASPLTGGDFLYRLKDINCALLFHEKINAISSTEINEAQRICITHAKILPSDVVELYISSSSETPVSDFSGIAPLEIRLLPSKQEFVLEKVTVIMEPWQLPMKNGYMLQFSKGGTMQCEIEGTQFEFTAPGSLLPFADLAVDREQIEKLETASTACWRLSIVNNADGVVYDVSGDRQWELSALHLVNWRSIFDGVLRRKTPGASLRMEAWDRLRLKEPPNN
jgi:hypothetical protein